MKICVLTHTFPRNDKDVSAAFMKEFCDGLVQNDNEVFLLAPFDPQFKRKNDRFKIYLYKYIWRDDLHTMGYSRAMHADIKLKKNNYILLPLMLLFGTIDLIKLVKKEKIQIINVHWILPNGLIALIASKVSGVPYVITLPGTDAYLAYKNKIFGVVAKVIALNSAGIVSNSSWHLKRILNLGIKNKPTEIISYSTDISKFKPEKKGLKELKEKLKLNNKSLIILAVGRIVYKKGFNYLIKAMPDVLKKFPNTYLLIGGEGDLKKSLENMAGNLKILKNILFLGNIARNEISSYYNMADIMIAPSIVDKEGNVDGGPLVSLESMACGKPQVVTNVLGVADIVKEGKGGYIIPQKNSKAISDSIIKLLKSRKEREKMGKFNRRIVIQSMNTKNIGKKYIIFFNKVLS